MFYDVTKYGVVGDGQTNNTEKINNLTKSMIKGGTLYFPSGEYVTGTIRLYSNITIHLDSGAKILGSNDIKDFPKISTDDAPGYTRGGYEALISAFNAENITPIARIINNRASIAIPDAVVDSMVLPSS